MGVWYDSMTIKHIIQSVFLVFSLIYFMTLFLKLLMQSNDRCIICFAVNVLLSLDETYADVMPVRLNENSPSAYV